MAATSKVSPLAPKSVPAMPVIAGVRLATAAAGIKYANRTDVLLVLLDPGTAAAGVFTQSKCPSAPVEWCRAKLKGGTARALVVNSGNANAFTGKTGRTACKFTAQIAARAYGEPAPLPASWDPAKDEFRRVQVTGTFVHDAETAVHGLAPGVKGMPLQGFYLFTPLRLPSGNLVMVDRGIVPTELREPATRPESRPEGEVTVTGLLRAPEQPNWFMPENRPEADEWFDDVKSQVMYICDFINRSFMACNARR